MNIFFSSIEAMRPRHWLKSGFCMAALFFSGKATEWLAWELVILLVLVFSLVSSAGYLVNDVCNVEEDRCHPRKRERVIARGALSLSGALGLAGFLYLISFSILIVCFGIGEVFWCVLAYIGLTFFYSFFLRQLPVVDVLAISCGFVLRVVAGAYVLSVQPSEWLMGLTYLLALLLGLGKRQGERSCLDGTSTPIGVTRQSLHYYGVRFGKALIYMVTGGLLVVYGAYCLVVQGGAPFIFTLVPVTVAMVDYVRQVGASDAVEAPEKMLVKRPLIVASFGGWCLLVLYFLYGM